MHLGKRTGLPWLAVEQVVRQILASDQLEKTPFILTIILKCTVL